MIRRGDLFFFFFIKLFTGANQLWIPGASEKKILFIHNHAKTLSRLWSSGTGISS
jgi:hypothetical protein